MSIRPCSQRVQVTQLRKHSSPKTEAQRFGFQLFEKNLIFFSLPNTQDRFWHKPDNVLHVHFVNSMCIKYVQSFFLREQLI